MLVFYNNTGRMVTTDEPGASSAGLLAFSSPLALLLPCSPPPLLSSSLALLLSTAGALHLMSHLIVSKTTDYAQHYAQRHLADCWTHLDVHRNRESGADTLPHLTPHTSHLTLYHTSHLTDTARHLAMLCRTVQHLTTACNTVNAGGATIRPSTNALPGPDRYTRERARLTAKERRGRRLQKACGVLRVRSVGA